MILTEDLQIISFQEAKDRYLFGPIYRSTIPEKLAKIFPPKFSSGQEESGEIPSDYPINDYYEGIPAPLFHLGFGYYFTTLRSIAKEYSTGYRNYDGPYFIDAHPLEINFGSSRTMMKWWIENGYNYSKTPETSGPSPGALWNTEKIRQERLRATTNMTETLKSKYDAVWFKGRGGSWGNQTLLIGDRICVYDSSKIYKVDKKLSKPGDIGSRVTAKVGIDPYNRGVVVIPIGTGGTIIDKRDVSDIVKQYPGAKERLGDSKYEYKIKWDRGGTMYSVLDSWIELGKERNLTKQKSYPISKMEEYFVVDYIKKHFKYLGPELSKTLRKVSQEKNLSLNKIGYEARLEGNIIIEFIISKDRDGLWFGYRKDYGGENNKGDWKFLSTSGKPLSENKTDEEESKIYRRNFWKIYEDVYKMNEGGEEYYEITKIEEKQAIDYIKKSLVNYNISKTLQKVKQERKLKHPDGNYYDLIDYRADYNGKPILFLIRKSEWGVKFKSKYEKTGEVIQGFTSITPNKELNENDWRLVMPTESLNEDKKSEHYLPISKEEEQQVVDYIKKVWDKKYNMDAGKLLKKIKHQRRESLGPEYYYDIIDYKITLDLRTIIFHIRKVNLGNFETTGVGFFTGDEIRYSYDDWITVLHSPKSLNESVYYIPISKQEEQEAVNIIKYDWSQAIVDDKTELGKTFKKIDHLRHTNVGNVKTDIIKYEGYINGIRLIFQIERNYQGIGYWVIEISGRIRQRFKIIMPSSKYEKSTNLTEALKIECIPITKQEEQEVVDYIKKELRKLFGDKITRTFRKVKQDKEIVYRVDDSSGIWTRYFYIKKTTNGVGFYAKDDMGNEMERWKIIPTSLTLTEALGKRYSPMTKQEEQEALQHIIIRMRINGHEGKDFKKIGVRNNIIIKDSTQKADERDYSYTAYDGTDTILTIRKRGDGIYYHISSKEDFPKSLKYHNFYSLCGKPQNLTEALGKRYSPMTKQEEQEAVQHVIIRMRNEGRLGKDFKKIASRNKIITSQTKHGVKRNCFADERDYSYTAYDGTDMVLIIRKRSMDGISYNIIMAENYKIWKLYMKSHNFHPLYIKPQNLQENDSDHGEALRTTGYWGTAGAGAIILAKRTGRILLPYRSGAVEQPHTWGVWGGAIDSNEDPSSAVKRELSEEVGYSLQIDELIPLYVYEDSRVGFRYHNFLAIVPEEFTPKLNWESENSRWVSFGDWPSPLHFGLRSLLENSKDRIFQEIRKYAPETPIQKPNVVMDKMKYNAAMHIIMLTWQDMTKAGDSSNRFDYENHFVHWMLNTQPIQDLSDKYGKQFYPDAHEPESEFQDDVEKVLEMLENKFNQRRAKKINPSDPLFLLKQAIRGKSWTGAKQSLKKISWTSKNYTRELVPDDMAEAIFNRLYRVALGETFFDKDTIRNSKRLNQTILTADTPTDERLFIQHYNGMKTDRFPDVVKVWRGLPSPTAKIRPGDFTTFDRGYARGYTTGKYGSVISDILPSKDLYVIKPDPDHSEMLYWPEGHQIQKVENVPSFRQFYNQWAFP